MASLEEQGDICVFAAGSGVGEQYMQAARRLGQLIGEGGFGLVYGGIDAGLMGAVAEGARAAGAHITGVLPRPVDDPYYQRGHAADLLSLNTTTLGTDSLEERKRIMLQSADAAVALPGGYGTLDEIVTAMELGRRTRLTRRMGRLVIVNTDGYYDGLRMQLDRMIADRTIDPLRDRVPVFVATAEEAVERIKTELRNSGFGFFRSMIDAAE